MAPVSDPVPFWWGLALGLLLMAGELLVPATVFLWTGISCLAVSLVLLVFPGTPMVVALPVWAVLSVVAVLLARRTLKRGQGQDTLKPGVPPNQYGADFIGAVATLSADSKGGVTRVDLHGANWGLRLPKGDLKAGARVRIKAVEGIYLVGEPLED